jgi:hypothetical protein
VSQPYRDRDSDTHQQPLSFDAEPGKPTSLEDLRARRRQAEDADFFPELDEAE